MHLNDVIGLGKVIASSYIGGQLEVKNLNDEYIYKGDIRNILLRQHRLLVSMDWFA